MRNGSVLVLYATETGNAHDVAEELGSLVQRLHFSSRVAEFDDITLSELLRHDLVIFVVSTTGQGEFPADARLFWRRLRSVKLAPTALRALRFVSFGLGDSSYPQFNYAHRKLFNRLLQLGAVALTERGEADEQHPEGVDGTFIPWCSQLKQDLLRAFPLSPAVEPIGDDVLLPPKWTLALDSDSPRPLPSPSGDRVDPLLPPPAILPIKETIQVTIGSNERVTAATHWQDVRHISLVASAQHAYLPGDVITIYPKNFPADVQAVIDLYGWGNVADVPLHLVSTHDSSSATMQSPLKHLSIASGELTIRYLLTNVLDIMAIPRRSFFSRIAHYTTDEFQRDRLREFTNPEYIDELYDYTSRPRRSILEVLQEFDSVKIPWQHLLEILPIMRGRQFSIASGGLLKASSDADTRFELLVAIVKYKTVIKKIRQGVCTRYIASLTPGQQLSVKLSRGGLNITSKDIGRPVVMIGPGTGVAPMRSLIHERIAWRLPSSTDHVDGDNSSHTDQQHTQTSSSATPTMSDVLFFGCRNRKADFFFHDEWARLQRDGVLDLHTAFSRDQQRKVYVQDLVRQQSRAVFERLQQQSGVVYICGSSGKMPQAVREALIEVFQSEGGSTRADAEAQLARMEKEGRYKQETW